MNYADIRNFTSHSTTPNVNTLSIALLFEKITNFLKLPFRPKLDPTRLSVRERAEAGILDCEVDWYRAEHAPLISYRGR